MTPASGTRTGAKPAPRVRTVRRPSPGVRTLRRWALLLAGLLILLYPVDWAVWRIRVAAGRGMGTAEVTEVMAATLKGNRFEAYPAQTEVVPCSHSLLPQAGAGACWWLARHTVSMTQY